MTTRIALAEGGIWVRPALESDEECGLGWKLRYAPDRISRADQLTLAQIVDAYGYLLLETTRDQRDRICRGIREQMRSTVRESTEGKREVSDPNSGEGWYEWHKMPANTTHIAYVHENGEVFDPEEGWNSPNFLLASAEGRVHRLVRADEVSSVQESTEGSTT